MGFTPLEFSIIARKINVANILIKEGASLDICNLKNRSIYQLIDEEVLKEKDAKIVIELLKLKLLVKENNDPVKKRRRFY